MPIHTKYHKGGKIDKTAEGYTGTTCRSAMEPYERAHGGKIGTVLCEEVVEQTNQTEARQQQ